MTLSFLPFLLKFFDFSFLSQLMHDMAQLGEAVIELDRVKGKLERDVQIAEARRKALEDDPSHA